MTLIRRRTSHPSFARRVSSRLLPLLAVAAPVACSRTGDASRNDSAVERRVPTPSVDSTTVSQKARPTYDGHWWLSISAEERSGFVTGYLDCHSSEYKGPARFDTKNNDRYRDLITHVYEASPTRRGQSVIHAVLQLRDQPGDTAEYPSGGEGTTAPHQGNDGQYWRDMSHSGTRHDEQLGFVEGFLQCHEKLAHNKGGTFSKTAEEYRTLISQSYRFDERTGDIDGDREDDAIVDVLFKFRDQAK